MSGTDSVVGSVDAGKGFARQVGVDVLIRKPAATGVEGGNGVRGEEGDDGIALSRESSEVALLGSESAASRSGFAADFNGVVFGTGAEAWCGDCSVLRSSRSAKDTLVSQPILFCGVFRFLRVVFGVAGVTSTPLQYSFHRHSTAFGLRPGSCEAIAAHLIFLDRNLMSNACSASVHCAPCLAVSV